MGAYRPKGRPHYLLRLMYEGQRYQKSTRIADKKLADRMFKKWSHEIVEEKWFPKEKRTPLHEAITEYLENYAKRNKISWQDDEMMLKKFEKAMRIKHGAGVVLQEITQRDIEYLRAKLKGEGLSDARTNRYVVCLKAMCYKAIQWGMITQNPVKGIKLFREYPREEALEVGQIRRLLEACSSRLRPIVVMAIFGGLRQGDILNLKWDNVDFENETVRIIQNKTQQPLVFQIASSSLRMLP